MGVGVVVNAGLRVWEIKETHQIPNNQNTKHPHIQWGSEAKWLTCLTSWLWECGCGYEAERSQSMDDSFQHSPISHQKPPFPLSEPTFFFLHKQQQNYKCSPLATTMADSLSVPHHSLPPICSSFAEQICLAAFSVQNKKVRMLLLKYNNQI